MKVREPQPFRRITVTSYLVSKKSYSIVINIFHHSTPPSDLIFSTTFPIPYTVTLHIILTSSVSIYCTVPTPRHRCPRRIGGPRFSYIPTFQRFTHHQTRSLKKSSFLVPVPVVNTSHTISNSQKLSLLKR